MALAALALAGATLAAGAPGRANPFDLYGFGARPMGMAGAYSAVGGDFTSVYYNPAGMTLVDDVDVGLGLQLVGSSIDRLEDVVLGAGGGADPAVGDLELGVVDNGGFQGGIVIGITEGAALGLGLYLPSDRYLAKLQSQSQRDPYLLMYDLRPQRLSIVAGAALEILDGVSVGVGVNLLFGPRGSLDLTVPLGGEAEAELALVFRPRVSPIVGLRWQVVDALALSFVYRERLEHGDLRLDVEGELDAVIATLPVAARLRSMIFYGPRQVTLGMAWSPAERWLLTFDLSWLQWSEFEDASLDVEALVGEPGRGVEIPFVEVFDPGFDDRILPRLGVEHRLAVLAGPAWARGVELSVRGGYHWVDSPVPAQTGITNFVDGDAHVLSAGLGGALIEPFGLDRTFTLDLFAQLHVLPARSHRKRAEAVDLDGDGVAETPVVGYPGYEVGGEVIVGGFTLGLRF